MKHTTTLIMLWMIVLAWIITFPQFYHISVYLVWIMGASGVIFVSYLYESNLKTSKNKVKGE